MKILLVHNYYGSSSPSGENIVFEMERELLRRNGHDVIELTRHSDTLRERPITGAIRGALVTPWNLSAASKVRRLLRKERIDVMHVHNTFPLISPAIFHAARSLTARVLTLHNYRLFCPAAIPMRSGRVCTDCIDTRSTIPALQHGCYRNSRAATVPLALSVSLHRMLGTWSRNVDAFIALTDFQKELVQSSGLPPDAVHVKPNFCPGNPEPMRWEDRNDSVVFAGRLSAEKGIKSLVQAWLEWGPSAPELRILGDGEEYGSLTALAATRPDVSIRFMGRLSRESAQREIAGARLLVLPSECFEGFPMVIPEAFAFATPVAASAIGSLPSIVDHGHNGVVFEPKSPESMLAEIRRVWSRPDVLQTMSQGARQSFDRSYKEDLNYSRLMSIYDSAIERSGSAR